MWMVEITEGDVARVRACARGNQDCLCGVAATA
jgi:hypothetical protein